MYDVDTFGDVLAEQYPVEVRLNDDREVSVRPLASSDREALLGLFRRIPSTEQGRFFREPATDPKVVAAWCDNIDPTDVMALVAEADGQIVADGTLHCSDQHMKQHVAELRLTVDPHFRHAGLGTAIVRHLLDLAPGLGIRWVDAEVSSNEDRALKFLERMRFQRYGRLPDHARDGLGAEYDVILMSRSVTPEFEPDLGGEG